MPLTIVVEPAPLESDTGGEIRVKGTRITLDTIISTLMKGRLPSKSSSNIRHWI